MDENTNDQNENTKKSLLNKKQSEMTVGDSLKVGVVVAAASAAAPILILTAKEVVTNIRAKRLVRKAQKELEKSQDIVETTAREA